MADKINSWNDAAPAGTDYIDTSDDLIRANWQAVDEMIGGSTINLVVRWASNSTVTVTCDRLVLLKDAAAVAARPPAYVNQSAINVTADITASGANGLDASTEILDGPSHWYYIWVIRDTVNGVTAALLSLSNSAPVMPGTYNYKRLVGAVYNDGSSNFLKFVQRGKRYQYDVSQQILTTARSDGVWAAPVSLATNVPARYAADKPMASRIFGYVGITHAAGAGQYQDWVAFGADAGGSFPGSVVGTILNAPAGLSNAHQSPFEQELLAASPMSFSYYTYDGGPNISVNAYLQGFEIEV